MIFIKCLVVVILVNISAAVSAEDNNCPDDKVFIPYHNTCMTVPAIPTCPEGETWIPYHKTCAAIDLITDEIDN